MPRRIEHHAEVIRLARAHRSDKSTQRKQRACFVIRSCGCRQMAICAHFFHHRCAEELQSLPFAMLFSKIAGVAYPHGGVPLDARTLPYRSGWTSTKEFVVVLPVALDF
jgi:predicted RNA-binding protein YlxR (DUF448 family)